MFVSLLWGTGPVVHKYLLSKYKPLTIMFIETLIYLLLLFITVLFDYKEVMKDINKISFHDLIIFTLMSTFVFYLAYRLYYSILGDHKSSLISALIYSSPVFTLILAYLFLKERLSLYGYLGILFIILGVICISQN